MPDNWEYSVETQSTGHVELPTATSTATYTTAGTTSPPADAQEERAHALEAGSDPELSWLSSPEAQAYEGHWVALAAGTRRFLGFADADEDVRRWQRMGASILYVAPRSLWIGG